MNAALPIAMYAVAVAEAMLLGRLLFLGFHKRAHYPFFAILLAADLIQTIAGFVNAFPLHSAAYLWFWAGSETVIAVLQVLAAREVCQRIRASYPRIGRLGEQATEWAFVVALAISTATLFVDVTRANWNLLAWSAVLVLRRAIATILAFTVAIMALCIKWAPAPVAPNVKRHARILAGYFATSALFAFLIASRLITVNAASVLKLSASALWFACWIFAFRRRDETVLPPPLTMTDEELQAKETELTKLVGGLEKAAGRLFGHRECIAVKSSGGSLSTPSRCIKA